MVVVVEVFLYNSERRLVDLVVLVLLQLFQLVQEPKRLEQNAELVVALLVSEVLLTTLKHVFKSLQSHRHHARVVAAEHISKRLDESSVY